jgi:NAD-dependent SIR2 family protein deacetylase
MAIKMKAPASIIILLGVLACYGWIKISDMATLIKDQSRSIIELNQENKKLRDIIDKKYIIVKPRPGI